jgi:predicted glycosyltransferase
MKIWIDLSNSPHPLLFAPIARRLARDGHEILVTARDNAQTLELAKERWSLVTVIGGSSPPSRRRKAEAIVKRVSALREWAKARSPDLALSHNSYAQIAAAYSLRLPIVTAMDYEYQPSNHLAFRLADVILVPMALSGKIIRRQGATPAKVSRYDGLKEQVYLGDFVPDPNILASIGIARAGSERTIVVTRPPPSGALYHQHENRLYMSLLESLASQPAVQVVALVRTPEQRAALDCRGFTNVVVPAKAVDSRSLMYAADLFVGAGGTMTRESALLGVPTLSVFTGRRPSVDQWLEAKGLLTYITCPAQVPDVKPRAVEPHSVEMLSRYAERGIDAFVMQVEKLLSRSLQETVGGR